MFPRHQGAVEDAGIIDGSVLLVMAQHHKCLQGLFTKPPAHIMFNANRECV